MYIAEIFRQWRTHRPTATDAASAPLPGTVYALGGTSLLTDISTEMVASILPVYLMLGLRLSPSQYGLMDGLFRGGATVAAVLLGGLLSYGSGRTKLVAGLGYLLSAVARIGFLSSGAFAVVAGSLVLDRFGKGLRVAPRDAMLAASVPPAKLGLAFGVHRAMDGFGAVVGPLIAALVLWILPDGYRWIFGLSLLASVAGLLVFFFFVRRPDATVVGSTPPLPQPWAVRLRQCLPPASVPLLGLAMLLTVFTVSEGMMYAHLQRSLALEPYLQPLLPVATAIIFLLMAVPMGRVADRFGATRVFCVAHCLLLPMYGLLAWSGLAGGGSSAWLALALVVLLGCFFAATDGVLMASVSRVVPVRSRSLSLALFAASIGLMKLVSSALFGLLWDKVDIAWASAIFALALLCGLTLFWWFNPFDGLKSGAALHS
ncbi:MAG: MFS transporter [Pseudomonadota bacterium]